MTEPTGTPRATSRLHWGAEAMWETLEPLLPGLSIEIVDRLDSTNSELVERLRRAARMQQEGRGGRASDDVQPQLLVAIHQTAGRGRLGRRWHSTPDASLTFSLALGLARGDWSGLSLAVGLALAEALDPEGGLLGLKWPNDVMYTAQANSSEDERHPIGRKLGGILIESVAVGARRLAVIGIGLNIAPQRLAQTDMPAASIDEFRPEATPRSVLGQIAPAIIRRLRDFDEGGFGPMAQAYERRDVLLGRAVRTSDPSVPEGIAEGVTADGALRVRAGDRTEHVVSGEVSVRPAAA